MATNEEKERLYAKLAVLDAKIANAKIWGGALTALNEERQAVLRSLRWEESNLGN